MPARSLRASPSETKRHAGSPIARSFARRISRRYPFSRVPSKVRSRRLSASGGALCIENEVATSARYLRTRVFATKLDDSAAVGFTLVLRGPTARNRWATRAGIHFELCRRPQFCIARRPNAMERRYHKPGGLPSTHVPPPFGPLLTVFRVPRRGLYQQSAAASE